VRIVAGLLGGRILRAPPGSDTRPTQEKVRAAVFSSLAAFVPGRRVLDLFSGSGAIGLEAWSRGAAHVEFVENAPSALRTLKQNLAALGAPPSFRVHNADVLRLLETRFPASPFDLVLADPPYREARDGHYAERIAGLLASNARIAPGGVFVFETEGADPPPSLPDWTRLRDRRYGKTRIWMWQYAPASALAEHFADAGS
jgi:16S rRNA (guanine966-N2)-methyltransferase